MRYVTALGALVFGLGVGIWLGRKFKRRMPLKDAVLEA